MKKFIFSPSGIFIVIYCFLFVACQIDKPSPPQPETEAEQIWVSAVVITPDNFTIKEGETRQLEVTVDPEDATDQGFSFQSSNTAIAEVDDDGLVSGKSQGQVYISVIASDGSGETDTVLFTVLRADPDSEFILWDWKSGDGFTSGTEVRGKLVLTRAGDVALDDKGNLLLSNNGRFTVGSADTTSTSSTYMPGDGAFDLSGTIKISLTYLTSPAGILGIYLNNNTTTAASSVLGSGSRISNAAPIGGNVIVNSISSYMGANAGSLANAFIQFGISGTGGSITINSITVERVDTGPPVAPEDLLAQEIQILGGNFSLAVGGSKQLQFSVLPATALDKQLKWASGNGAVASVSSGFVSALGPGYADITATSVAVPGVSKTVRVTVTGSAGQSVQERAAQLFSDLKGKPVVTNGWADRANSGAGLSYTNPANFTLIDDVTYPADSQKLAAFKSALAVTGASFIILQGDVDLSEGKISDADHSYFDEFHPLTHARVHGDITVNVTANTTIIGLDNARIKYGGVRINNITNVIIRNITFYDAHGSTEYDTSAPGRTDSKASIDALVVQGTSSGVWVDHCKFTDGVCNDLIRNYNHDGAFDIPAGKNITVSWCEFTNHDKVMLVAGSDALINPLDRQITLHHNYFHDGVTQRMPRSRGTQMHVYNNYYNNIGVPSNAGYSLGPGVGSQFIVENNYFGNHTGQGGNGIVKYFDISATPAAATFSRFYQSGNIPVLTADHCTFDGTTEKVKDFNAHLTEVKPWTIPYAYSPEDALALNVSIPAGAGTKLDY
jgi:pectate lyase